MLPGMFARVTFQTADGDQHELGHGDIIGRLWSATLQLSDARVSEAHAMVSLRGGQLKLLALRGLFAVDGKPRKDLLLEPGQRVAFARGLEVEVVDVALPEWVMGLAGDQLPRQPLPGACSLVCRPNPALVPRVREGHAAVFWSTGDGWLVRRPDGEAEPLVPGWALEVDGQRFEAVRIQLDRAGQSMTRLQGAVQAPLTLELHWDTVNIHRDGLPTVTLKGHPARLLTELASINTGVNWEELGRALWGEDIERNLLRRRFDTVVNRMRRKLKADGIRPDLIRPDGAGNFALVLRPDDTLDDRS